jgi:hypothetical protein
MIDTTLDERKRAEIDQPPKAIAADAAYGNQQQLDKDAADNHIPVPNPCARIGTLPTSAYAPARTSTTSAASAATRFVNGHPSPASIGNRKPCSAVSLWTPGGGLVVEP